MVTDFPALLSAISTATDRLDDETLGRVIRDLSPTQRRFVRDKNIHGDFTMATVRALKRKGLFHLVIDSPNGQCGFMRLTVAGEQVSAALLRAQAEAGE